jgi:hypothetical protein
MFCLRIKQCFKRYFPLISFPNSKTMILRNSNFLKELSIGRGVGRGHKSAKRNVTYYFNDFSY